MHDFLTIGWPWIGLALAAALTVLLFCVGPRFRDLSWLAWLTVPVYLVHQFEEHGIDLLGRHYAFRDALCQVLHYGVGDACPIPVSFITAVNLSLVWIAMPLGAWLGRRRP